MHQFSQADGDPGHCSLDGESFAGTAALDGMSLAGDSIEVKRTSSASCGIQSGGPAVGGEETFLHQLHEIASFLNPAFQVLWLETARPSAAPVFIVGARGCALKEFLSGYDVRLPSSLLSLLAGSSHSRARPQEAVVEVVCRHSSDPHTRQVGPNTRRPKPTATGVAVTCAHHQRPYKALFGNSDGRMWLCLDSQNPIPPS